MNRRRVWVRILLGAAVCGWALDGGATRAQPVPPPAGGGTAGAAPQPLPVTSPPLPTNLTGVQASNNAAQIAAAVQPFITAQLRLLAGDDARGARTAKLSLIAGAGRQTSVAYADGYSAELATQLGPVLSAAGTSLRTKVAAGVVVSGVATGNQSGKLEPVVEQLLADPSPAVAMLGMHAAKPLIAAQIVQPVGIGLPVLVTKVVDSFKQPAHLKSPFSGYLATDAYAALMVDLAGVQGANPAVVRPLFEPLLDVLEARIGQYADGMPPLPGAERALPTFLTAPAQFPALPAGTQMRITQDMVDLVDAQGQRAMLPTNNDFIAMVDTAKRAVGADNVIGTNKTGNPPYPDFVRAVGIGANRAAFVQACSQVFPKFQAAFPDLKRPQTLKVIAPPP